VHLPDGVLADACTIDAYQTGSFGGYSGGPESAKVNARTVSIPTSKAAQTLKAVVWCKGLGVALVDVPALPSSNYQITVTPPRLKPLRLNARLQPDDAAIAGGKDMQVTFEAGWICAFFNVLDCMVPRFPIATARIGKDGAVSFDVPDVLADPVIKKYGFLGGFAFDVEEPAPSFNYYRLEPPGGRTLAPASAYRDTIILTIRK
jgi:hypothetical protein